MRMRLAAAAAITAAGLSLHARAADLMDDLPPLGPDGDMKVLRWDSPEARACSASARSMARNLGARVVRSLFTYSPRWGMVWRGDLVPAGRRASGSWRYTCAIDLKGKKRFVVVPARDTPKLASGPWGEVRGD